MKKVLVVDSCIRKNSKTRMVLNSFLSRLSNDYLVEKIYLNNNDSLIPLNDEILDKRNKDIINKEFNSTYYDFAKKLKECDIVIIAAPFYDLTFPSVLKIFIEQTLISNLTFVDTENGVKGIINCNKMIYITVRGMECNDYNNIDVGTQYLKGYCNMLNIQKFCSISYSAVSYDVLKEKIESDLCHYDELINL